jgi:hypothetical protein
MTLPELATPQSITPLTLEGWINRGIIWLNGHVFDSPDLTLIPID